LQAALNKLLTCQHNLLLLAGYTRSLAIDRKSRPYRLRPKPSLRFPVTQGKRFVRGETVSCTPC